MSSVERFAREIESTRRLAWGHATSPQLTSSTIGPGGLEFQDNDGNTVGKIVIDDDGGFSIINTDGPVPPTPTRPLVTSDGGLIRVEWGGSFEPVGEETPLPTSDLDRVEIHASKTPNFVPDRVMSYGGSFASNDGGSFTLGPLGDAGTYYVRLVARSKAKRYSPPSLPAEVWVSTGSIDEAVTDAWLVGDSAGISADGKNSIWRGPDEPEIDPDNPPKDGDIWFEMTEDGKSIPNIWDEDLGEWVGNDDYRQSEIERVQQELREDLDAVITDGSGTKNFYRGTMPTDEESSEGDLWFDSSDENKPYIYENGEWITVAQSFQDSPGVGTDIVGWPLGSPRQAILDGQVTNVSGFEFGTDSSDKGTATVPSGDGSGTARLVVPLLGSMTYDGIELSDGGDSYTGDTPFGFAFSGNGDDGIKLRSVGGDPVVNMVVRVRLPDGIEQVAAQPMAISSYTTANRTHQATTSDLMGIIGGLYPPLADSVDLALEILIPDRAGNFVEADSVQAFLQITEPGIASGAITETKISDDSISTPKLQSKVITTDKIAVGAITAESGIIGSINAGTIITGQMHGARIRAGTLNANTVLIESSIGSTLIKDGAILTDHIKAGAITAESGIIGSIDANVITVGKIMGNQLDADAVNGKTITGAIIRTASSGSRVELTKNGLKQYNSLGATIVDMTSGSFFLEGGMITGSTIRTAVSGTRVEITSTGLRQYNSNSALVTQLTGGGATLGGNVTVSGNANVTGEMRVEGGADNSFGQVEMRLGRDTWNSPSITFTGNNTINSPRWTSPARISGEKTAIVDRLIMSSPSSTNYGTSWQAIAALGPSLIELAVDGNDIHTWSPYLHLNKQSTSQLDSRISMGVSGAELMLSRDSHGPYVSSRTIYGRTVSASANIFVSDGGAIMRTSSARRFKQDEEVIDPSTYTDSLLSVDYKSWRDKGEVQLHDEYLEFRGSCPIGPVPKGLAPAPQDEPVRHVGAVAEDLVDAGLTEFVQFDSYGQTQGINYDRIGVALIPIVRDLRDRITELEAQLAAA